MKTNSTEHKSLFTGYSRKKLHSLAETYEELAKLYRNRQKEAAPASADRKEILYRNEQRETNQIFANHLEEISEAFLEAADTVVHVSTPMEHKKKTLLQHLKKHGIQARELIFIEGRQSRRISMEARCVHRGEIAAEDLAGLLSVYFNRRLMPALDSAVSVGKIMTFLSLRTSRGLQFSALFQGRSKRTKKFQAIIFPLRSTVRIKWLR